MSINEKLFFIFSVVSSSKRYKLPSCSHTEKTLLKPDQNKKGQKIFQLHRFFNTFLQLAAEKKYSKKGAAGNFFGPSYFVTALVAKPSL